MRETLHQSFDSRDLQREDEVASENLKRFRSHAEIGLSERGIERELLDTALEDAKKEVRERGVHIGIYRHAQDVVRILESGTFLVLGELNEKEQEARAKSWSGRGVLGRRRVIEQTLGWNEERPVHHLLAEVNGDEHAKGGPGDNYGAFLFQFNEDDLEGAASFTIGDSLNANGVHRLINRSGSLSEVSSRVIPPSEVHETLALMRAVESLSPRAEGASRFGIELNYVEVQTGAFSGQELFGKVKKISIDTRSILRELPFADVLSDGKDVFNALYREYHNIPKEYTLNSWARSLDASRPQVEPERKKEIAEEMRRMVHAAYTDWLTKYIEEPSKTRGILVEYKGDLGLVASEVLRKFKVQEEEM